MLIRTLLSSCCALIMMVNISTLAQQRLFDGATLQGWQISEYPGHGSVYVTDSCIVMEKGETCTGIRWIEDFPATDYQVALEAKRTDGSDFFCGITFPVVDAYCTLIIGGWGGNVIGISSIDGYDAANNATGQMRILSSNRWYAIRLRVGPDSIEAWIDNDKIVEFEMGNQRLSLRWEMEPFKPFGIATWKTTGLIRNVLVRCKGDEVESRD
jgi:hypothetical protein